MLVRGSQLPSSHQANHATADTSCSTDGVGFGGIFRAVVIYLFAVTADHKPKEPVQRIQRSSCVELAARLVNHCSGRQLIPADLKAKATGRLKKDARLDSLGKYL